MCRYILSKELKDLLNLNTNFPHSKLFPRHVCEGQWSLLPGARERDTWRPLLPALVHGHAPQPHLPAPRVPGGEHCDVNIWNINLLVTFRCGTPPTFVGTEAGSRAVPGATPWTPLLGGSTATLSHAVRTSCFLWLNSNISTSIITLTLVSMWIYSFSVENVTDVRNYNVEVEVIEEKTTIIEVTEYLLLVLLVACLLTVRI